MPRQLSWRILIAKLEGKVTLPPEFGIGPSDHPFPIGKILLLFSETSCTVRISQGERRMIRSASEFGVLVRLRRKERGWTQAQLAERCGTGERFIVELEKGKPGCHLEKALIAARTVGIDLVDQSTGTVPINPRSTMILRTCRVIPDRRGPAKGTPNFAALAGQSNWRHLRVD